MEVQIQKDITSINTKNKKIKKAVVVNKTTTAKIYN